MTGLSLEIQGFPTGGKTLLKSVENHIVNGLNTRMSRLEDLMRTQAPKDLGDHSRGYRLERFRFTEQGELSGAFVNEVQNSLFRERGRPPGKRPPIRAIEGWARRRGLSPYLVAKKIGDEGTERWIENENPLGINRASQPGNIIVNNNSPVRQFLDEGIEQANNFSF